ncbi:MoxR family ATPase [Treponema sp.]|uniref:AAA family ATPase n=1 Tax=Treponema sp. TaxID=166 RepID=UPI00298E7B29|nr:MoxR family ATPase [Treponema sp.]MCR5613805.1 MoxR family ATPase [Treponema sp.]
MDKVNTINESDLAECRNLADKCRTEAAKRLVGQTQVIDGILTALVAGGHILLEGVPGLAKTLAVRTFAEISVLDFKRIQFTPDLLPADLTGTLIYEQSGGRFTVRKGPVFTNVVFADEINRSPAKVQSALLEAMAEHQVTIGENSYKLPEPFFVLATQNPVEQEGTYNLPEAELDRFLMKIVVPYPTPKEEVEIVKTCGYANLVKVSEVFDEKSLSKCRNLLERIVCDDKLVEYIVSIVNVTRPSEKSSGDVRSPVSFTKMSDDITRFITYGASPRAGIALLQCAKVHALFQGRSFVLPDDIKAVALPVLRHRLILSYEASASGVTADDIITKILDFMPLP